MTYSVACNIQVGEFVKVKRFTGLYKVTGINILPKTIYFELDDGFEYSNREIEKE